MGSRLHRVPMTPPGVLMVENVHGSSAMEKLKLKMETRGSGGR